MLTQIISDCLSPLRSVIDRPFPRRKHVRNTRHAQRFSTVLDALEDRTLLSAIVVTTNADTGPGSLREALTLANAAPDLDTITFALQPGQETIRPTSELPLIAHPVEIIGAESGSPPAVQLDGSLIDRTSQPYPAGLRIHAGNSLVSGLTISAFHSGIVLYDGDGNTIRGNYLGTDLTGMLDRGNTGNGIDVASDFNTIEDNVVSGNDSNGIWLTVLGANHNQVVNNLVGTAVDGLTPVPNTFSGIHLSSATDNNVVGNLVSGNQRGIVLDGTTAHANTIHLNRIGTDISGSLPVANSFVGLWILSGAHDNLITENLISGNADHGVLIMSEGTTRNRLHSNLIGTDAEGDSPLGNGKNGILIALGADDNIIGEVGRPNILSANGWNGIQVQSQGIPTTGNTIIGNRIGTTASGDAALGNAFDGIAIDAHGTTVRNNLVSGNHNIGILLSGAGGDNSLIDGNYIGTNLDGTVGIPNASTGLYIQAGQDNLISNNVVSSNGAYGVVLETANTANNSFVTNTIGLTAGGTTALGNVLSGLLFFNGTHHNAFDGNLISGNGQHGVVLKDFGTSFNTFVNNTIGLNRSGTAGVGNGFHGVLIESGSTNNAIGTTAGGNVISGNSGHGVQIRDEGTTFNVLTNNIVGLDASGTDPVGNGLHGIHIAVGADANVIGINGHGNTISGNGWSGVRLQQFGLSITGTSIESNRIGTDITGLEAAGNGHHGIASEADDSTIAHNLIAYNGRAGVFILDTGSDSTVTENTIRFNGQDGIRVTGSGDGNRLQRNSIDSNGGEGIDLAGDGVTANDADDVDSGPNALQNFPVIDRAIAGGQTMVRFRLHSTPNSTFEIEFFANAEADASQHGEGHRYLGSVTVLSDATGLAVIDAELDSTTVGEFITATATSVPLGNTSEFSQAVVATELNQPPQLELTMIRESIPEDITGVAVATISIIDDGNGTNTLSLTGADAGLFKIDGVILKLRPDAVLDFETHPVLDVTVSVDDPTVGSSPDDSVGLSISVTNVAPVIPVDVDSSVNEVPLLPANGIPVGITAFATDATGEPVTYSLVDSATSPFIIDAVTGVITVRDGLMLNDSDVSYSVTVVATDTFLAGGLSSQATFLIDVLSADEQIDDMIDLIDQLEGSGSLNGGQSNALRKKLQNVLDKLDRGQTNAAANQLQAFSNQVTALINQGVLSIEEGQPLLDAANAALVSLLDGLRGSSSGPSTDAAADLTSTQANRVWEQAASLWRAALPHQTSTLDQLTLHLTDLPGDVLGLASTSSVWIDVDAAGFGWWDSVSQSSGQYDLLSAMVHEIGHTLGYEHGDGDGLTERLRLGERVLLPNTVAVSQPVLFAPAVHTPSTSDRTPQPAERLPQPVRAKSSALAEDDLFEKWWDLADELDQSILDAGITEDTGKSTEPETLDLGVLIQHVVNSRPLSWLLGT